MLHTAIPAILGDPGKVHFRGPLQVGGTDLKCSQFYNIRKESLKKVQFQQMSSKKTTAGVHSREHTVIVTLNGQEKQS